MNKYKVGEVIKGKVTGIEDYGFFIFTEDGYNGLVHISEITDIYVKNVADYVNIDDEIFVRVLEIDEENKKLKLSIKNFNYKLGQLNGSINSNGFKPLLKELPGWIDEYFKKEEK